MNQWQAMILDPSRDFSEALSRCLAPHFRVICCGRVDDALAILRSTPVDVLILELALPGLDGLGLLRQLELRPPVLVVSNFLGPYVQGALADLGVQYALRKPCSVQVITDRAVEMAHAGRGLRGTGCTLELLNRLGLPGSRQGFQILLTALPLLSDCRDQRMGKELYEEVGRRCGMTPAAVEKGIRDAVRAGWAEGNPEIWQQYFPGITRCPRNKEFLFRMADILSSRRCG